MRKLLFFLGCFMLWGLWFSPLAALAEHAFFAHMIIHMGVVAVAAPFLALGMAQGRFDPVRKCPLVFAPIPASMVEFFVVWAWHVPWLHQAARHSPLGLVAEQVTFLFSGLFLWLSIFGGEEMDRDSRSAAGVIALLLTAMHMTLLGVLIALAPRPLYSHHAEMTGLTTIEDQHLGGAVMVLMGGATYIFAGLWLTSELLNRKGLERVKQQ
jgi:putative membrane protein